MRITTSGNVGIGTTNPAQKLSVNGNILTNSNLFVGSVSDSRFSINDVTLYAYYATEGSPRVALGRDVFAGGQSGIALGGNAGYAMIGDASSTGGTGMAFSVGATLSSGPSTEKMRITLAGNVGIGITNPSQKLDVQGNIIIPQNNYLYFDNSAHYIRRGSSNVEISGFNGINLITSGSTRVTVAEGGNVGIGTDSPNQKLHVSGAIAQTLGSATTTHFVGVTGSLTTNTVIASVDVTSQPAYAVFFDYVVYDNAEPPTNARAGSIMTVNNGSTSRYTDTSTSDIGDTTPVDFSTSISGNNLLLTANIASGTWFVNLNYRRF
jgi:hypothetical protein